MKTIIELWIVYAVFAFAFMVGLLFTADDKTPAATGPLLHILHAIRLIETPQLNPNHVPLYMFAAFVVPPLALGLAITGVLALARTCEASTELAATANAKRLEYERTKPRPEIDARERRFAAYAEQFGRNYQGASR